MSRLFKNGEMPGAKKFKAEAYSRYARI